MQDQKAIVPLPAHSKDTRDKARALFREGQKPSEIATALQLSASTVRAWKAREGWQIACVDTEQQEIDVPDELSARQEIYEQNMGEAAVRLSERVKSLSADELIKKADKVAKGDLTARRALHIESPNKSNPVIQIALLQSPQVALRHKPA